MELTSTPPYEFKEGALLLFDKPIEWSSFQLVKKIKYQVNAKVGHAGTLDPLATGLMILCTGKFTKQLERLQGLDKEYTGVIKIGATTPSYDRETQEENLVSTNHISEKTIQSIVNKFTGKLKQVPPMFSAIKKDGKKLYELAREGKTIYREPRDIEIKEFEIEKISLPYIHFRIHCTKGTYIRSIANDVGEELGVGGYLYELRRTKIGRYSIEDAWTVEKFVTYIKTNK